MPVGGIGTISETASRETAAPSSTNVAPLAVGDGGRAEASLARLSLLAGTDTPITAATIPGLHLPDVIAGYHRYDLPNGLGTVEVNRQTVRSWTECTRTYTVLRQDAIVLTVRPGVSVGNPPFGLGGGGTFTVGSSTAGYDGKPCVT